MRLSDINTIRLLPNFCKNDRFIVSLCGTMDYIIKAISARLDALPLNAGGYAALQKCRDDELAELASETMNAPYFPDLDRESREELCNAQDWWTWRTGTREILEYALTYVYFGGSVLMTEFDGKYKHHYKISIDIPPDSLSISRTAGIISTDGHVTAMPVYIDYDLKAKKIETLVDVRGISLVYKMEGTIYV